MLSTRQPNPNRNPGFCEKPTRNPIIENLEAVTTLNKLKYD